MSNPVQMPMHGLNSSYELWRNAMNFNWSNFWDALLYGYGGSGETNPQNTIQIQYLDEDAGGSWRNAGSSIPVSSSISQRMKDVASMRAGRRVRAIDSVTNSIVDVL